MTAKTIDFTDTLVELDGGAFTSKLTHALAQCALGVVEHGAKGRVQVIFNMKRIGDSHQINLEHKLSFKAPTRRGLTSEEETTSTPVYVDGHGSLTIMPISQGDLFKAKPQDENSHG
jgi:hypothetical protein